MNRHVAVGLWGSSYPLASSIILMTVSTAATLTAAGIAGPAKKRPNLPAGPLGVNAPAVPHRAGAGQEPTFEPGHVLVRFKPGTKRAGRRATHQAVAVEKVLKEYTVVDGLQLVQVPGGTVHQAIATYQTRSDVLYAEPDYIAYPVDLPNDPDFGLLLGLHNTGQTVNDDPGTAGADIRAAQAWDVWTGDPSFLIAVVDTGVDYTHPDLQGNIWTNPGEIADNGIDDDGNGYIDDVHGYNVAEDGPDPMDTMGHGTHVSGTIGAVGNDGAGVVGVNWQCQIVAIKFLNPGGAMSDAVEAMEYIIANQIRVSNHSWAGGGFSQALYDAIQASQQVGHIFVAAAANGARNNDFYPTYPATYDLPNIISVAAMDNDDELAGFSHHGLSTVDLGAPGVSIYSTLPGASYEYFRGTSMATPHVTGVVALLTGREPSLSWREVRDRIFRTVRRVDSLDGRVRTGGVVSAGAALDCNNNGVFDGQDILAGTSADCSGNGIPDTCDTDSGSSIDCDEDDVPDECEPDCNENDVNDGCDVADGTSPDCNQNLIPDECETPDCNENGIPDDCDIADGTSGDCDGDTIPDECEPDCNTNGIADDCDIADGTSEDCSGNRVPDECEPDCNTNGIADSCDIVDGTSGDCSDNGIPDECESPDVVFVDHSANGANDGSSWSDAFNDVQEAIQAAYEPAGPGGEVWVAAGTYVPTMPTTPDNPRTATFKLAHGVRLYGGFAGWETSLCQRDPAANPTVLSGDLSGNDVGTPVADDPSRTDNSYRVVLVPASVETGILNGFTVSGGYGNEEFDWGHERGGGVQNFGNVMLINCTVMANWNSNLGVVYDGGGATLIDCVIRNNHGGLYGGGMYVLHGVETQLIGCEFSGNTASQGAGVFNIGLSMSLTDCTFWGNHANTGGGGLKNHSSRATLERCTFIGNTSDSSAGGIGNFESTVILNDCVLSQNSAENMGGGMYNARAIVMLSNCAFTDNHVTGSGARGGAMANTFSTISSHQCTFKDNTAGNGAGMDNFSESDSTLTDCVFSGNRAVFTGGAVYSQESSVRLQNCTIAGNTADLSGGGLYARFGGSSASINTVFWGNDSPQGHEIFLDDASLSVTNSDVEGGQSEGVFVNSSPELLQWGTGNIDAAPQFVDADNGDLHLLPDSPCIDAGDNTPIETGQTDIDGHPRIYDGDEVDPAVVDMGADEYTPDCNRNGVPDDQDIAEGTSADEDSDGIPDECVDCVDGTDCDDDDACTFERCLAGWCDFPASPYGDVDHNETLNIFDLFCVLNGFGGDFSGCSFEDVDIEPCGGNDTLNIFDLFAVLNAFAGEDPCCGGLQ